MKTYYVDSLSIILPYCFDPKSVGQRQSPQKDMAPIGL